MAVALSVVDAIGMSLPDAIGIGSAILTTIGFAQSNLPAYDPEGATVNIKGTRPAASGGSINHVYAYDNRNGYAGQAKGCKVDSGGICTVTIDQSVGGRVARYISLSNNNDATCIAWISVSQFDKSAGGTWTGDIGYGCGEAWYNSVESAGQLKEKDGGGAYVPKCTWIDGDHSGSIVNSALKFDVFAYGEKVVDTTLSNGACEPTIYGPDIAPIADAPAKRSIHKRERPAWMADSLVMSNFTSQPAFELCTSETSWGPDFIGPDSNFCDMQSKTLMPLCSMNDIDGCIEVDEEKGHVTKRMTVARRSASVLHKSYTKISKWGN